MRMHAQWPKPWPKPWPAGAITRRSPGDYSIVWVRISIRTGTIPGYNSVILAL